MAVKNMREASVNVFWHFSLVSIVEIILSAVKRDRHSP